MAQSRICSSVGVPACVAVVLGVLWAGLPLGARQTVRSDYRVGSQDVLRIAVFNEPDLSGVFTVDGDGTITFPLISRVSVRSGPRNLDSGLSEISIVFQAAVPKLVASKYTTSGVRRPSEL